MQQSVSIRNADGGVSGKRWRERTRVTATEKMKTTFVTKANGEVVVHVEEKLPPSQQFGYSLIKELPDYQKIVKPLDIRKRFSRVEGRGRVRERKGESEKGKGGKSDFSPPKVPGLNLSRLRSRETAQGGEIAVTNSEVAPTTTEFVRTAAGVWVQRQSRSMWNGRSVHPLATGRRTKGLQDLDGDLESKKYSCTLHTVRVTPRAPQRWEPRSKSHHSTNPNPTNPNPTNPNPKSKSKSVASIQRHGTSLIAAIENLRQRFQRQNPYTYLKREESAGESGSSEMVDDLDPVGVLNPSSASANGTAQKGQRDHPSESSDIPTKPHQSSESVGMGRKPLVRRMSSLAAVLDLNSSIESIVSRIRHYFIARHWSVADVFRRFDVDGDTVVTREEFRVGILRVGIPGLLPVHAEMLANHLDRDGNGYVDISELNVYFNILSETHKRIDAQRLLNMKYGVVFTPHSVRMKQGEREREREREKRRAAMLGEEVGERARGRESEKGGEAQRRREEIEDVYGTVSADYDDEHTEGGNSSGQHPYLRSAPAITSNLSRGLDSGNAIRKQKSVRIAAEQVTVPVHNIYDHNSLSLSLADDSAIREQAITELINALHAYMKTNHIRDVELFRTIDVNKDGCISKAEFRQWLMDVGCYRNLSSIEYLLSYFDRNNDGKIDFTEFRRKCGSIARVRRERESDRSRKPVFHRR